MPRKSASIGDATVGSDDFQFSTSDNGGEADDRTGGNGAIDPSAIGSGSSGNNSGDGGDSDGDNGSGRARKRRSDAGQKRGPRGSKKAPPPNLDFISDLLLTIHAGLAIKTGWEELALDEEEANKLARSSVELAEQYGVEVNPKTQAWLRFIGAIGSVYGTRAVAIILKEKEKAKPEEKPAPGPRIAILPNA